MHLSGGDGFATMADGHCSTCSALPMLPAHRRQTQDGDRNPHGGRMAAAWPAPAIVVDEGKEFYLTLTNVGMLIRPDLFDPHTVHFHGFPQSSTVFDGLPESGLSINMGASLTYYYNLQDPGTYMYHCHVEATEHMQMGMLGNLYVRPAQNSCQNGDDIHSNPTTGRVRGRRADHAAGRPGSVRLQRRRRLHRTRYDVEKALQLGSFDPEFHDASWFVQPLPFAMMWDRYPMINGRGYPDTINPGPAADADRIRQLRRLVQRRCRVPGRILAGHRHRGPEGPAAAVQPQHHRHPHADEPQHPDAGGGHRRQGAARRRRRDAAPLHHQLGDPGRRHVGRRDSRHDRRPGRRRTTCTPPTCSTWPTTTRRGWAA